MGVIRGGAFVAIASGTVALYACASSEPDARVLEPAPEAGFGTATATPPPVTKDAALTACESAQAARSPFGCEYAVVTPSFASGSCTAVLISNPGDSPTRLTALHGGSVDLAASLRILTGKGRDPGFVPAVDNVVPPHASAMIALVDGRIENDVPSEACPFVPLRDKRAFFPDEGTGTVFIIRSDHPVSATYFGGYDGSRQRSPTATALRALGSWDVDYIDVGAHLAGRPPLQSYFPGETPTESTTPSAAVVAVVPSTKISLEKDLYGPRPLAFATMETHQFRRDDLYIGTKIQGDNPIALFVGAAAASIPFHTGMAGPVFVQVPPPIAWASEYAAVGHPQRMLTVDDAPLYRIVAKENGTAFTYDPAPPEGAPLALQAGEVVAFRTSTPFVLRSQDEDHRFYVSLAMTGAAPLCAKRDSENWPGQFNYVRCPGGPELVNVTSPAEYAERFAFTTDHAHADVHLVLVRKKKNDHFAEVKLDCAGTVLGWTAIGNGGTYETTTVTLSQGNFVPQVLPGGTCELGPHTMASENPFTAYLWGWTHEGVDGLGPDDDGSHRGYGFALYGMAEAAP